MTATIVTAVGLQEYAGITRRQVDHWTEAGYLRITSTPAAGATRIYDTGEDQVARWMGLLIRHGFTVATAAQVARQLHETGAARIGLLDITPAVPALARASP